MICKQTIFRDGDAEAFIEGNEYNVLRTYGQGVNVTYILIDESGEENHVPQAVIDEYFQEA